MLWLGILWLACAYLLIFGALVLLAPARALGFLSAFAQTWRANLLEAILRLIVGLAFLGAAPQLRLPNLGYALGALLTATALLMMAVPGLHRRFAARAVAMVGRALPLLGIGSLGLAVLLGWLIG